MVIEEKLNAEKEKGFFSYNYHWDLCLKECRENHVIWNTDKSAFVGINLIGGGTI